MFLQAIPDTSLEIKSIFDFIIGLVIIFGIFRGYTQGFIVQTISLFALLVGTYLSAIISMAFYDAIVDKSNVPLQNLPVITFALFFGIVVFASNWVGLYTKKMVSPVKINIYSRVWGALFGAIKYLLIVSIFLLFFDRLARSFELVDEATWDAKKKETNSVLYEPVLAFAPLIIPKLKFEIKQKAPLELDDITNEPEPLIEEIEELEE